MRRLSKTAGSPVWPIIALLACLGPGCGKGAGDRDTLPSVPMRGVWHKVSSGESVQTLARRYGVEALDIEELNGLERRQRLTPGSNVFVPGATEARVAPRSRATVSYRPADGSPGDARKDRAAGSPSVRPDAGIPRTTNKQPPKARPRFKLVWPLKTGTITSRFGRRGKRVHEGVDISAPEGTAIMAAGQGVVIYAGDGVRGYGNMVLIRHPNGLVTVYAHNKRNLVQEGTRVSAGQVIGEVGKTGRTSGHHLHFEVRIGETPRDPLKYVRP